MICNRKVNQAKPAQSDIESGLVLFDKYEIPADVNKTLQGWSITRTHGISSSRTALWYWAC
ncbi:hypothetical protein PG987_011754 [Apiospora arundinis]